MKNNGVKSVNPNCNLNKYISLQSTDISKSKDLCI